MDSDDPVGKAFRKGKRVIKIPLNGSQKMEMKNISLEDVPLTVSLYSSRFRILNGRKTTDGYRFKVDLLPDNSIVIEIKDIGHVEINERERKRYFFEGVLLVESKGSAHAILLDTDPATESYKKLRSYKDGYADCDLTFLENDKIKNFVSIEPISDDKYGKTLPNNVKMLKLSADDERHNAEMRKAYIMDRIGAINPFMETTEYKKALETIAKDEERLWKAQQESIQTPSVPAASQSRRSTTSEKSDAKSMSKNSKSTPKSEKTTRSESAAFQSKRSVISEKSAINSGKTTKSEMVQKSEKVDLPKQKNGEKKKKKKKRCVIC